MTIMEMMALVSKGQNMTPEEFTLESPYYSDSEAESVYSSDDDDDESDSSSVSTSLYTILFSIVVGSDRS